MWQSPWPCIHRKQRPIRCSTWDSCWRWSAREWCCTSSRRKTIMTRRGRGERVGPYETLDAIGAGGMGEVWKARDTRLGRTIAIKVSKQQFSERFEREARAVAALNHPHICQLYDVGPDYLVMEFVEGAPLKGPLPAAKAIEYAGQILEALDAAHRKGITHRDLKPANILVTKQIGRASC